MPKDKNKIDNDFDLDLELDYHDLDFGTIMPKDDRKPVTKLTRGIGKGIKAGLKDTNFIRRAVRNLLPTGFKETDELVELVQENTKRLMDESIRELKPLMKEIKRLSTKAVNPETRYLPRKVKQLLKEWKDEESSNTRYIESKEDQRDAVVQSNLSDILQLQVELDAKYQQSEETRDLINQGIESKRFKDLYNLNIKSVNALNRISNYNTNIDLAYKKKSLEIQYRQLFVNQDILTQLKEDSNKRNAELLAIVKNTSLPDYVKMKNVDKIQDVVKNQFTKNMYGGLFKNDRAFLNEIVQNVKSKVLSQVKGFKENGLFALSNAEDGYDMLSTMKDLGGDYYSEAGGVLGRGFAQNSVNKTINKYKDKFLNSKLSKKLKLKDKGLQLEQYLSDLPATLNAFKNKNFYFDDSKLAPLKMLLQEAIPGMDNNKVSVSNRETLFKAATYSNKTDKAITEIIPGYLARILREIQVFRTNDETIGLTKYNYNTNDFTSQIKLNKSILSKVIDKNSVESTNSNLDVIIKDIESKTNTKLDNDSIKSIKKALLKNTGNNQSSTKTNLLNYNLTDKARESLGGYLDSLTPEEKIKLTKRSKYLRNTISDTRGVIQDNVNLGNLSELKELGIVNKDNTININNLLDYYIDNEYGKDNKEKPTNYIKEFVNRSKKDLGNKASNFKAKLFTRGKDYLSNTVTKAMEIVEDAYIGNETAPRIIKAKLQQGLYKDKQTGNIITSLEDIKGSVINEQNDVVIAEDELDKIKYIDKRYNSFKFLKDVKARMMSIKEFTKNIKVTDILDKLYTKFNRSLKDGQDVYVQGESIPRMYGTKIKQGLYSLKDSGKIINGIDDIIGDVIDEENNIVITKEELDKLVIYDNVRGSFSRIKSILKPFIYYQTKIAPKIVAWNFKQIGKGLQLTKKAIMFGIRGRIKDVFVGNESNPRLYASKIRNGEYYLKSNMKLINHQNDVIGEVVDSEGNTVVSINELEDLRIYESIFRWFNPLKLAGIAIKPLIKAGKNLIKSSMQLGLKNAKFIGNIVKSVSKSIIKTLVNVKDVYVIGKLKPVLLASLLKQGKYVSAKSGKVITHQTDIDGEIMDEDGNLVITNDDLKKGLVDSSGKPLKGIFSKISNVIGKINRLFSYRTKLTNTRKIPRNINNAERAGMSKGEYISYKTLNTIEDIKNVVTKAFNKPKLFGDNDGDGDVENSWLDKLRNRKNKDNTKPNPTNSIKEKDKGDSWISKLSGMLVGTLGSVIGKFATTGLSLITTLSGAFLKLLPKLATIMKSGSSLLDKIPGIGKIGKLGKYAKGIKYGGAALTAGLAGYELYDEFGNINEELVNNQINQKQASDKKTTVVSSTVGGLTGAVAGAKLGALAGASIGSFVPVVGTAAGGIIGGVIGSGVGYFTGSKIGGGVSNYILNKRDSKGLNNLLDELRYVQYGFNRSNKDYWNRVFKLENYLSKYVISNRGLTIDEEQLDIKFMLGLFGLNAGNQNHLLMYFNWYQKRFKPIYLKHIEAIASITKSTNLDDIYKLDKEHLKQYLLIAKFSDGPYDYNQLPITDKIKATNYSDVESIYNEIAKYLVETKVLDKTEKDSKTQILPFSSSSKLNYNITNVETNENKAINNNSRITGQALFSNEKNNIISALDAVKFKLYGLNKLHDDKVRILKLLENKVFPNVSFNGNVALWKGNINELIDSAVGLFGLNKTNRLHIERWLSWFRYRFLPTYMGYLSGVKVYTNKTDKIDPSLSMKAEQQLSLCRILVNISVWNATISPWLDYELNTNPSSCNENISYLESLSKKIEIEQQSKPIQNQTTVLNTKNFDKYDRMLNKDTLYKSTVISPDSEAKMAISGSDNNTNYDAGSLKSAGGTIVDGRNAKGYIVTGNGVNLDGLNPELLKAFYGMVEEYGNKTGKKVTVTSGARTMAQQAALFSKYGAGRAARPGSSLHEFGLALDADPKALNEMEKMGLMRKYGLTRPVGGEDWHVEPIGIQSNINKYKTDQNAAMQAIISGIGKGGGGLGTISSAPKYSRNANLSKSIMEASSTPVADKDNSNTSGYNPLANRDNTQSKGIIKASLNNTNPANRLDTESKPRTILSTSSSPFNKSIENVSKNSIDMSSVANTSSKGYDNVKDVIIQAAKTVGVDPEMMLKKAAVESNFNPNAKAKGGSAAGLFQFLDSTWKEVLGKYGSKYGYDSNTSVFDAKANALMAAHYAKDNMGKLSKVKGGDINSTDMYLAHFLGPGGASSFLKAYNSNPNSIAADILPSAANSNKNIFYDGSRARTVSEVYSLLGNKVDNKAYALGMKKNDVSNSNIIRVGNVTTIPPKSNSLASNIKPDEYRKPNPISMVKYNTNRGNIETTTANNTSKINQVDRDTMSDNREILSQSLDVQKQMLSTLNKIASMVNIKKDTKSIDKPMDKMVDNTPSIDGYKSPLAMVSMKRKV